MGQDVFISYKSEEFQEADWVRQLLDGTAQHHRRCQLCHGDPTGHPELPGCTLTEAQTESLDLTGFPKLRPLDISGIAAWQQLPEGIRYWISAIRR